MTEQIAINQLVTPFFRPDIISRVVALYDDQATIQNVVTGGKTVGVPLKALRSVPETEAVLQMIERKADGNGYQVAVVAGLRGLGMWLQHRPEATHAALLVARLDHRTLLRKTELVPLVEILHAPLTAAANTIQ